MKKIQCIGIMFGLAAAFVLFVCMVLPAGASGKSGEVLFKEHCAVCHPDGGNIINPKKTLHKKDREANNIKTEQDILKFMRKPGPGMTTFDAKAISDKEAKEIAEYIMKTFK